MRSLTRRTTIALMGGITVIVFPAASMARSANAQETAYEVAGIIAWSTSKTYGFTFHPEAASGESLTRPLDGMNTRLTRTTKVLLATQTLTVAQVIGGQPSVMPNERNTTFTMFGGRTLQPGWTVKSVDVGGNFTYVQQPRLGTSDLSFRVRLAPGGSATVRKIVLSGPSGADWKDAFAAPARRDYVINGVVAWNAAKNYGFTFTPLLTGHDNGFIRGEPDGVFTALAVTVASTYMMRCTELNQNRSMLDKAACILGQVVGGNMSVTMPVSSQGVLQQTVAFEMFGGKKLSPGWIVKSVSISNGSWTRQPAYGSGDLSFVLTVTSYGSTAANAIIKSITLEGPSNAAGIEDAFKNAQNR